MLTEDALDRATKGTFVVYDQNLRHAQSPAPERILGALTLPTSDGGSS